MQAVGVRARLADVASPAFQLLLERSHEFAGVGVGDSESTCRRRWAGVPSAQTSQASSENEATDSEEKSSIDIVDMAMTQTSDGKTMLICPKCGATSRTEMVKAK